MDGMELWLALTLRDLGFLLYGGPLVAFTIIVSLSARIPGLTPWAAVRTYRAWGPALGLSLGATVFGALAAHHLQHGAFVWTWDTPAAQVELAAWLTFLVMWASNIKLEIWTLQPLRSLDPEGGISDEAAYRAATRPLARHMGVHAALVLAVFLLVRLAGAPFLEG